VRGIELLDDMAGNGPGAERSRPPTEPMCSRSVNSGSLHELVFINEHHERLKDKAAMDRFVESLPIRGLSGTSDSLATPQGRRI
jgi:hypothetical protein